MTVHPGHQAEAAESGLVVLTSFRITDPVKGHENIVICPLVGELKRTSSSELPIFVANFFLFLCIPTRPSFRGDKQIPGIL